MRIKLSTLQQIIAESMENAYDVLGIKPGASKKDILAAWRGMVLDARSARGGGRGGLQGHEINYYNRAAKAAMANLLDPTAEPVFEPRAVRMPPEPKAPRGMDGGLDGADAANPLMDPVDAKALKKRKAKASYKVYGPWGKDKRSVVRVQGQLYGTGPEGVLSSGDPTMFGTGDNVGIDMSPDLDGRLRVSDSGHDQVWDPVDEVRKVVDQLVIETLMRQVA